MFLRPGKKKPKRRSCLTRSPDPLGHHQERINDLETRLAVAQDAARATPSPPASADPPSNTAPGLFVHTRERPPEGDSRANATPRRREAAGKARRPVAARARAP